MRAAASLLAVLLAAFAQAEDSPEQRQLDFANGLFQREMYAEAIDEYERFLAAAPTSPEATTARYRLGEAAYATAQYDKALAAFDQVLAATPAPSLKARTDLSRGEVLYYLKKFDDARAALAPLAKAEDTTQRSRALYYLGRANADAGNPGPAAEAFRAIVSDLGDTPLAPYAQYQLGFALLAQQQYEDAAVQFSAAAASKADDATRAEARYRAAQVYDQIAWHDAAADAYQKLLDEFPNATQRERATYGLAWARFRGGDTEAGRRAAEAFDKAYPESPLRVGTLYLSGCALQHAKKYDEALAIFNKLRETAAQTEFGPAAQYRAAWVRYLKGEVDPARDAIQAFLTENPTSPYLGEAAFLLGTILVGQGDYENAQQQFRLVYDKYPDSEFGADALFKSAECLSQLGATDQAATLFEEFATRYPENPLTEQAILRAGDANFNAQAFKDAVEKYRKILDLKPSPEVQRQTLYRLAITYHNMKEHAKSADTFRTLAETYPDDPRAPEAWYRIGEHLLRDAKDPRKAIDAYDAAIAGVDKAKADPAGIAGFAQRGIALAHYEQKDYDAAATAFLKLAQTRPEVPLNEDTYAWAGQRFFDAKQWENAATMFQAMLTAVPTYPSPERILFLIAECSDNLGKVEDALARYQQVIDATPAAEKAVEARYRIALLHEKAGRTDDAIRMLEEAANANAGDVAARARFHLGELHEARGEHDKAARSFMRVAILFLHPELSPEALWRAASNFQKAGSTEQARNAYNELLQDYPSHARAEEAKAALAQLPQAAPAAPATTTAGGA